MPNMLFANNANTTLASSLTNVATTMSVTSATGFPVPTGSQYFYCTLADAATQTTIEIVKVTAVAGSTFTIVRGQDGTTGTAFSAGDVVSLRLVRASLNDFSKLDENNTFSYAPTFNTALAVGSGGTGVTASSGANSVVLRDSNQNVFANNFIPNTTTTVASSTPINLTVASAQYQIVTGTTTSQTFNMPDATTLTVGDTFYFNNNITYSSVQINAHDGTTSLLALQAGGVAQVILLTNGTSNGTWDVHSYIPASVSWGTATLNFNTSSSISGSVSWLGNTVGVAHGGTGLTSLTAGYIPYGNGTSALNSSSNLTFNGNVLSVGQTYDQGTGVLQATGTSAFNGNNLTKTLYLQGGNNLLIYSNTLNNAIWGNPTGGSVAVTTSAVIDPQGGTNAWQLVGSSGSGGSPWWQNRFGNYAGQTITGSIWLQSPSNVTIYLKAYDSVSGQQVSGSNITVTSAWQRFSLTWTASSTSTNTWFGVAVGNNTINAYQAQAELGSVASAYTPTTTSAVTTNNNIYVPSGGVSIGNTTDPGATNLSVTGSIASGTDATINGITVGLGSGNVASNTVFGFQAGKNNGSTGGNVNIGFQAGYTNSGGSQHTNVGFQAGYSQNATQNVNIGFQAGYGITGGNFNTIIGGYTGSAAPISASGSNWIVLADGGGTVGAYYQTTSANGWYQKNNSTLWSITSDIRIKKNVVSLKSGLDVISKLRPIEFDYIENNKHDIGFIAQEYQTVLPAQISEGEDGMLSLNQNLVPYLVKALQELNNKFDAYVASHP